MDWLAAGAADCADLLVGAAYARITNTPQFEASIYRIVRPRHAVAVPKPWKGPLGRMSAQADINFERELWETAVTLRGTVSPGDYKHYQLTHVEEICTTQTKWFAFADTHANPVRYLAK